MIVAPGNPSDPTRVELDFHSDGRIVVKRIGTSGMPQSAEFRASEPCHVIDLTANPAREAFFRIMIYRER